MSRALAAKVEELERKRLELEETIHFPGRARGRRVGGRPRGGDTHAGLVEACDRVPGGDLDR